MKTTRCARAVLGFLSPLVLGWAGSTASVQSAEVNYDETRVPAYTLPDPLTLTNGETVLDVRTWQKRRRPEILRLFQAEVYGASPGRPTGVWFEVLSADGRALEGKAFRKQVRIHLSRRSDAPSLDLLLYLPLGLRERAPAFLGLNFGGNHTIHTDPGIALTGKWVRNNAATEVVENRATEASRGSAASRWPVLKILERGYAVATVYCGDLEPDWPEGWRTGVRGFLRGAPDPAGFAAADWGAIGAWAWGLSRVMDYFERSDEVDARRVAVLGHSRLGKTALWAGAQDTRFALVISNNSGCGGAALSRRRFGETVARINGAFPHWFCGNFKKYNEREDELPLDQHLLIALIAPRPVYVASAAEDLWADPRGEFLAALHAEPVYGLFGKTGLGVAEMPPVDTPVGDTIGYHVRTGKHDVTDYDWDRYLDLADRHLKKN